MSNQAPKELQERWTQMDTAAPEPEPTEQPGFGRPERSYGNAPRQLQERWAQTDAAQPTIETLDRPTGGDSYWTNPITVAMHYNGMLADTQGIDWSKFGVNPDMVSQAYDHFASVNNGKPWWEWHSLSADDPFLETLKGMQAPPKEAQYGSLGFQWKDVFGDATPAGLTGDARQQPTMGTGMAPTVPELNPQQLAELPAWQQLAYRATTSPLLQGASQMLPTALFGAATGLALGGPLGAIVGAVSPLLLGAGLGGLVDPSTGDYLKQHGAAGEWVDMAQQAGQTALEWIGLPGQWMEQGLGTAAMLAEPNIDYLGDVIAANIRGNSLAKTQAAIERDVEMKRLLDNLGQVWETSKLTYESTAASWGGTFQQNLPAGIEWAVDMVAQGQTDVRFAGLGYVHRLGIAEPIKTDKVGLVALNAALTEVLNGHAPEQVLQKYQDYFGVGGQMVDLFNQSFADPLNIVPFAESGALGQVAKWTGNPTLEAASKLAFSRGEGFIGAVKAYGTELRAGAGVRLLADGRRVPMLPTEYTRFQRAVSGVSRAGTIAELTPGVVANRGILTFVDHPIKGVNWLNKLNDLSPQSKVAAVQEIGVENAALLSKLAGQDVGQFERAFKAWADMPPQQAAEVARILGMPEAATVRQFMADFVAGKGGLNDLSAAWRLGEAKRSALSRISTLLSESVNDLVKQIQGDDLTADVLLRRILEKDATLASNPTFGIDALREMSAYFKTNWWAAHPEFYKAHVGAVLIDKVTANAIKSFGVKPGSALERVSMSMRSLQNVILLNLNPAYLVNNVANNIVMQAYEGVFGFKRQSTISADFRRLLGADPFRLREGAGPAGDILGGMLDKEVQASVDKLRAAGRGKDWTQAAQDFAQSVNRKLSGVQKASATLEGQMSAQAMHAGVFRSLPYIKELLAPSMDPQLTAKLRAAGVNPDRLRAAFTSARSVDDIEKIISGQAPMEVGVYVPDVARALGMDAARISEMLEGSGVMQELNRRLGLGQPVDEAMAGLDTDLRRWLDRTQQEDLISQAEDVANRVQAEGMGATFDILFDIFDKIETEWTRHMADLDSTYELANRPGVQPGTRRMLISEAMEAERQRFEQLGQWVRGTYSGVLEGMRFDPELRQTFALRLDEYYQNWQAFYESRDRLWRGFAEETRRRNLRPQDPDYQAMKQQVQAELGRLYDGHGLEEQRLTAGLGDLFTDMVGRQLGDDFRPAAADFYGALNTAQDLRRQVMSDFRAWERGEPGAIHSEQVRSLVQGWQPDRAGALWPQFHERVYVPTVGQYIQSGYDGLMRLYRQMNGEPVAPRETMAAETYAARLEANQAQMPNPIAQDVLTARQAAQAGETPAQPRPPAGFTRGGEIQQALLQAFPDMPAAQRDAYFDLISARARAWARQNGRPAEEYYRRFGDIRQGGPGPEGLGQSEPPRGAVQFLDDGRAVITAFQSADVSTLAHELGHVFRRDLNADDLNVAAEWSGAIRDEAGAFTWTREAEEKFADGFVNYLKDGRAPTARLRGVFEKFKGWLSDLYQTIRGRQDIQLNTAMRGVFDRLLSDQVDEIVNKFAGRPQHLGQMDEGALSQMGWQGGRKHLLNAVNKDRKALGLETYKVFEEVPWHEAQSALFKRNPSSLQGVDKFVYTKVTDMPDGLQTAVKNYARMLDREVGEQIKGERWYNEGEYGSDVEVGGSAGFFYDWYLELTGSGMSKAEIIKGLEAIAAGTENPDYKYVERMKREIYGRLLGYTDPGTGAEIPANIGALMWAGDQEGAGARFGQWFYGEGGNRLGDAELLAEVGSSENLDWLLENAPVPYSGGDVLFQRGSKPAKGQMGMFNAGEDTPLFSGVAQTARESTYNPQANDQPVLPGMEAPRPEMKGAKPGGSRVTDAYDLKRGQIVEYQGGRYVVERINGQVVSFMPLDPDTGNVKHGRAPGVDLRNTDAPLYDTGANYYDKPAQPRTLFQEAGQPPEQELAAVGPMLPGALHSQGSAPMHQSQVHGDAYDNYIRPVLTELRRQMTDPRPQGATRALDADGVNLLNQWLADAKQAHGQATLGALRMGEMYRDAALLNYGRRYNFDGLLSMIMPYEFFATRSMTQWAMRVMDKPAILSWFARIAGLQHEQEDRDQQLPSRLRGKMFMPMPFLPDWMGDGVFFDPLSKIFPFRDQLRPYEQLIMEGRATDNRAVDLLKEMAKSGQITPEQAQAAMSSKSGALWERAIGMAQASEGMDWTDMASLFVSPALYLTVPYKLATGQTEDIGPFPPSRMIQALSAATGIQGLQNLDFEAQWKKNAGLSPYGKWGDYYIDRQLVNLVADGVIDYRTANIAMIERSGPAYDQAVARVQQELMMRNPGALPIYTARQALQGKAGLGDVAASLLLGWIPTNILPAGEMQVRGLQGAYSQAWDDYKAGDKKAIDKFLTAHPEFKSRTALYAEPEERLRNFLTSEVWDRFGDASKLDRRSLPAQLGDEFELFLDGKYDTLSNQTLASWAQALGGAAPGVKDAPKIEVTTAAPDLAAQYDAYQAEKNRLFAGINDLWAEYNELPKGSKARKDYWKAHPELKKYMDWQESYLGSSPELKSAVKGSDQNTAATSAAKVYQDIKGYPGLLSHIQAAQYGETISKGSLDLLKNIWEKNGKPSGNFKDWLLTLGVEL